MEEWTAAVSAGAITTVADNIITVHTTYFCGSVTAIRTAEGLVLIDTAKPTTASQTLAAVRRWDDSPVHTVIYTHVHIDHTSGIKVIDEGADAKRVPRPRVIAHRNVVRRLDRYEASHGFNSIVQGQQFDYPDYVYPIGQRRPDLVYDDTLSLVIGGERLALFHGVAKRMMLRSSGCLKGGCWRAAISSRGFSRMRVIRAKYSVMRQTGRLRCGTCRNSSRRS